MMRRRRLRPGAMELVRCVFHRSYGAPVFGVATSLGPVADEDLTPGLMWTAGIFGEQDPLVSTEDLHGMGLSGFPDTSQCRIGSGYRKQEESRCASFRLLS